MELTVRTGQPIGYRVKAFWACNKRKIRNITIILAILIAGLFLFTTFCVEPKRVEDIEDDDYLLTALRWELDFILTGCSGEGIRDAITKDFNAGKFESTVSGIFQGWASTICVMLWMASLITAYINQQAYTELIIKKIMVLAISGWLIANAPTICDVIMEAGQNLALAVMQDANGAEGEEYLEQVMLNVKQACADKYNKKMYEFLDKDAQFEKEFAEKYGIVAEEESKSTLTDVIDGVTDVLSFVIPSVGVSKMAVKSIGSFTDINIFSGIESKINSIYADFSVFTMTLSLVFMLLIPMICTAVAYVIIRVVCYSRGIEMAILRVMSPIPMSMVASDNSFGSGAGARFLKNIAAISLQGAVLVAIPTIIGATIAEEISNVASKVGTPDQALFKATISLAAVAIAEATIMGKSLSLAQKTLGLQ